MGALDAGNIGSSADGAQTLQMILSALANVQAGQEQQFQQQQIQQQQILRLQQSVQGTTVSTEDGTPSGYDRNYPAQSLGVGQLGTAPTGGNGGLGDIGGGENGVSTRAAERIGGNSAGSGNPEAAALIRLPGSLLEQLPQATPQQLSPQPTPQQEAVLPPQMTTPQLQPTLSQQAPLQLSNQVGSSSVLAASAASQGQVILPADIAAGLFKVVTQDRLLGRGDAVSLVKRKYLRLKPFWEEALKLSGRERGRGLPYFWSDRATFQAVFQPWAAFTPSQVPWVQRMQAFIAGLRSLLVSRSIDLSLSDCLVFVAVLQPLMVDILNSNALAQTAADRDGENKVTKKSISAGKSQRLRAKWNASTAVVLETAGLLVESMLLVPISWNSRGVRAPAFDVLQWRIQAAVGKLVKGQSADLEGWFPSASPTQTYS